MALELGNSVADVASMLGMSENGVVNVRERVHAELRGEDTPEDARTRQRATPDKTLRRRDRVRAMLLEKDDEGAPRPPS